MGDLTPATACLALNDGCHSALNPLNLQADCTIVRPPRVAGCTPPGSPTGARTRWPAMEPYLARMIAERVLAGVRDPDGTPLLSHVRRVAAATPPEAQVVAWLHEVLEEASITEHELLEEGLSTDELRALRLLSRPKDSRSDVVYLAHLELIARAAGRSGHLARLVKIADLEDRRAHPRVRPDGWAPPYARGQDRLLDAARGPAPVAAVAFD
jgi:hypothetical protein